MLSRLIVCLFLLSAQITHAQSWFDENPQWINDFSFGFAGSGYEYVSPEGDTVLLGKPAIKIRRLREMNSGMLNSEIRVVWQSGDTIRAWHEQKNDFFTLYNFSLAAGDTVDVRYHFSNAGSSKYVVQDTGTMLIDGRPFRFQDVQWITGVSTYHCNARIIEKIGMVNGTCVNTQQMQSYPDGHHFFIDDPNQAAVDGPAWFLCRYRNDSIGYKESSIACDALTAVKTPVAAGPAYRLVPNPFAGDVFIETRNAATVDAWRVYDAAGHLLMTSGGGAANMIRAAELPPGFYLVEVSGSAGRAFLRAVRQ